MDCGRSRSRLPLSERLFPFGDTTTEAAAHPTAKLASPPAARTAVTDELLDLGVSDREEPWIFFWCFYREDNASSLTASSSLPFLFSTCEGTTQQKNEILVIVPRRGREDSFVFGSKSMGTV